MLKNTTSGIYRDYPREMHEARQGLWLLFKADKEKYDKRSVNLKYPAVFVVNGDVRDLFTGWFDILRGSCNSNLKAGIQEKSKLQSLRKISLKVMRISVIMCYFVKNQI